MSKFLIQAHPEGPKWVATVSKEGPFDQRDGASWVAEAVAMADTEAEAVRDAVREWIGDPE